MNLWRSLSALWELTDQRQRLIASGLVVLLFVSGALEMVGMLVLFSYISGLAGDAQATGWRYALRGAFERLLGPLSELQFAVLGGLLVVGVFVFKNLFATGVSFLNTRFLMKLYAGAAPRLFEGFLRQPYSLVLVRGMAEPTHLLGRMLGLFNASVGSAMQALSESTMILMIGGLLLLIDPLLTIVAGAVFAVALTLANYANRNLLVRMGSEAVEMQRQSNKVLREGFGGFINIRLHDGIGWIVGSYARLIGRAALLDRRRRALSQLPRMLNEILLAVGIVASALFFGLRGQGIEAAVPTLALFGLAGLRLTGALSRLMASLQLVNERQAELDSMMADIRQLAPDLIRAGRPRHSGRARPAKPAPLPEWAPRHFSKALELQGVAYTYPTSQEPALDLIDLAAAPGRFVGFCGPSGSGKSTLMLVMTGLIKPSHGDVRCDGWSIFDHLEAWQSRIAYVGQRPFIAAASIRDNVAIGQRPDEIDDDKIWHALEIAQLADMVHSLPEGLGSMPGEDGCLVSGGQRQRLDIARAIYTTPEILFLDEATAALDNITERKLVESLRALGANLTIFCVAHRLSTIRDADIIHVLERGKIVASDGYDRLMSGTPKFRELARSGERG